MSERGQRLARMLDAGVFKSGMVARTIWCNGHLCGYTLPEPYSDDEIELIGQGDTVSPTCRRCGEPYQCGDCGYEIDQEGNCLREEGHDA
jgi:hypothetical protein